MKIMKTLKTFNEFLSESAKLPIRKKYVDSLISYYTTYTEVLKIENWSLDVKKLEKINVLIWKRDDFELETLIYNNNKEQIKFILTDTENNIDMNIKNIVGSDTISLEYTENYLLDVGNYVKSVEQFIKKLNSKYSKLIDQNEDI